MRRIGILLLTTLAACAPSPTGPSGESDSGSQRPIDASQVPTIDASSWIIPDATKPPDANTTSVYPDATPIPDGGLCGDDSWECSDPVADGCMLGTSDICGDGFDNNCDGNVDENCPCTQGDVQPCFLGPPGKRGVGSCQDGAQTCFGGGEFTSWGECEGGIWPTAEVCDTQDNDCNGCNDDHPDCCQVELNCPGPGDLPEGIPFAPYIIDGTNFWSGAATSWSWTVQGGPCDRMLDDTSGVVSYTLAGANTSNLTFTPTLSGDYTVTMTVVDDAGNTHTCTFIVHIAGPGLRVELCWDTTGSTDIDLHLHKPDSTTPWFTTDLTGSTINPDDCFYYNCKAQAHCLYGTAPCIPGSAVVDWGYTDSPLAECSGGPEGSAWTAYGSCTNPRLDIDNVQEAGRPENINVDAPQSGKTYRVMVHHYAGATTTHPMVNVYCGGHLQATYGGTPDLVSGFDDGGGLGAGPMWRVVDVTPTVTGGATTDCDLTALHPPGTSTGYWVTNDDRSY